MTAQGLPKIGDMLDDRYEIVDLLGKGGFGAVYLARQLSMDRKVALKVLVAHAMKVDEMIARFRREVLAIRNLSHPNTIRIYDFADNPNGLLYYSMEHVKGPTLTRVLKQEAPIAPARAAHITKQVLKSLSEAHASGIIHRDLKPANIMLAEMHGETDFVKVLDFGIAKLMDGSDDSDSESEQLTNAGVLVGTINYMSPEQIGSKPIGPPSDIYALGLIGVEMLTGQSVFAKSGKWEILHKQISDEPNDVPDFVKANPLGQVFWRALEKNPVNRYQSADEMIKAIAALGPLDNTPLVAKDWSQSVPIAAVQGGRPISQSGPISIAGNPNTPVSQSSPVGQSGTFEDHEATQIVDSGEISAPGQQIPARLQLQTGNLGHGAQHVTAQPAMPIPPAAATHSAEFQIEQKSGSKKLVVLAVVLGLLVIGGGAAAVVLTTQDKDVPVEPIETTPQVATVKEVAPKEAPPAEPEPEVQPVEPEKIEEPKPEPKEVELAVAQGITAQVFDQNNRFLGVTPLKLEVEDEQTLTLRADKYEPATVTIGPDSDPQVKHSMTVIPEKSPTKPDKKPNSGRKTPTKNDRPANTDKKPVKKPDNGGWVDIPSKDNKPKDTVPIF